MRKADKNSDSKMSQKELKHFLRQVNIEVDDDYAEMLFEVRRLDPYPVTLGAPRSRAKTESASENPILGSFTAFLWSMCEMAWFWIDI